jgi:lysophospholipase L1-like esterase
MPHPRSRSLGGALRALHSVASLGPQALFPFPLSLVPLRHKPRIVIFYAGDNDIAAGRTPQQVFDDYKAFVAKVHAALPATRIAFIAIKPSIQRWALVDNVRAANALVREHARSDERLGFVDVDGPMLGWDEKPRTDLFVADGLHMTARGYEIWTTLVRPFVDNEGR